MQLPDVKRLDAIRNQIEPISKLISKWLLRKTAITAVRRVAPLRASIATDIGAVRKENQDRAAIMQFIDNKGSTISVLAVADGIGGMSNGASCAALAIGSLFGAIVNAARSEASPTHEWLCTAAHVANREVFKNFEGRGGTTLVALLLHDTEPPYWLSVGDSRVYRLSNNQVLRESTDDTIAGQLGNKEAVDIEQTRLLQFVGMGTEIEPHVRALSSDEASSVILTTDGVHYIENGSPIFSRLIVNSDDVGICAKRLIDVARWCGGHDNASLVMVNLPFNSEKNLLSDQNIVELWDAFGELQIAQILLPVAAAPSPPNQAALLESTQPTAHVKTEGNKTRKPPRKKTAGTQDALERPSPTNRRKKKTDKGDDRNTNPELFVEFSEEKNKGN